MENKSCPTKLISFFDEVINLADKGDAVSMMYSGSCEARSCMTS